MNSRQKMEYWLKNDYFDSDTRDELNKIKDDDTEIEDRFYKDLEFGTGGLRGIIGAGTNRINKYTVRKASQGFSNYISEHVENYKKKGIVIAYDSRHKSDEFAEEAARVFAGNGIKAYVFDSLRPTPELSFAVRYLKAAGGIVITASHNPKEYNGYKVYGEDGGQLPPDLSDMVLERVNSITDITSINIISKEEAFNKGLYKVIGAEIDNKYMETLEKICINREIVLKNGEDFKIIYTPIHGSGNIPVRRILDRIGFKNVLVVNEQEYPDPDFSTVKYPNPEDEEAFELAIKMALSQKVDIIIGTDPDCDRVGVVVRNDMGEYLALSGNQIGCLLMDYIISQKKKLGQLPSNSFVVKTIVTSEMANAIAEYYGIKLLDVLTGFKFIGEKIRELDEKGDYNYLFGFEESYGYLAGTDVRDKDGVVASMLIAEMALYYNSMGVSVYNALKALYKKFGFYMEAIESFALEGKEGQEKIKIAMEKLRNEKPYVFGSFRVNAIRDYEKGIRYAENHKEKLELPKSNVLYYEMAENCWFCIRPSGTEPKIKIYFGAKESSEEKAGAKLNMLKSDVLDIIKNYLQV